MKILFTRKEKQMFSTVQKIEQLNDQISRITNQIIDLHIREDLTLKMQKEFERRRIIETRDELLLSLKQF